MDYELELVEQARQGSKEAFSTIIRTYQAKVRSFLGRYLRQPDIVEDVAQDSFLDAYRKLPTYRAEAPLRFWLLGIARNCALRYLREEERRRAHGVRTLEAALAALMGRKMASDDSTIPDHERRVTALEKCLGALPEQSSRLITAIYYERQSAVEIARRSGRKETAVWQTLSRIRQALRQCVEGRLKAGETV